MEFMIWQEMCGSGPLTGQPINLEALFYGEGLGDSTLVSAVHGFATQALQIIITPNMDFAV